jgi:hypothetical protein
MHKGRIARKVKNQFIDNDDDVMESKIQLVNKTQLYFSMKYKSRWLKEDEDQ